MSVNWLHLSTTGECGSADITVTADTHSDTSERIATITCYNNEVGISGSTEIVQTCSIISISIEDLEWEYDVPFSGGVADKNNCSYNIIAHYNNGATSDVTASAIVTGFSNVPPSEETVRHSAGILTLFANYGGHSTTASILIQQDKKPFITLSPSDILFDVTGNTLVVSVTSNIDWNVEKSEWINVNRVQGSNNGVISATTAPNVSTEIKEGFINVYNTGATITATTIARQEKRSIIDLEFVNLSWVIDVPGSGGTADKDNCLYTINAIWNDGTVEEVTPFCEVLGSLDVDISKTLSRRNVGELLLTAKFGIVEHTEPIDAYQAGNVPKYYVELTSDSAQTVTLEKDNVAHLAYPTTFASYDKINWFDWSICSTMRELTFGPEKLYVAGYNPDGFNMPGYTNYFQYIKFQFGNENVPVNVSGSVMGLIDGFEKENIIPQKESSLKTFAGLFYEEKAVASVSEYFLDAIELYNGCYSQMFEGTSIESAPNLPAIVLATECYSSMFKNCQSLSSATVTLGSKTLPNGCYSYMFSDCSNLKTFPLILAEKAGNESFYHMFDGAGFETLGMVISFLRLIVLVQVGLVRVFLWDVIHLQV